MDQAEKSRKVMYVASTSQKKVLNNMQSGDEKLFLMYIKEPITQKSIDNEL